MPKKRYTPEEIVAKLRQVDVLVSQRKFPHWTILRKQHRTGKSDAELGRNSRPYNSGAGLCLCVDHSRSLHAFYPDGRRLLRGVVPLK